MPESLRPARLALWYGTELITQAQSIFVPCPNLLSGGINQGVVGALIPNLNSVHKRKAEVAFAVSESGTERVSTRRYCSIGGSHDCRETCDYCALRSDR